MAGGGTTAGPSTTATAAADTRHSVSLAQGDFESLLSQPHQTKPFPEGVQLVLMDQPGTDAASHLEQVPRPSLL